MPNYRNYPTPEEVENKVYTFKGGVDQHDISFTNAEATHAVTDFHAIIDRSRVTDVPYNLGIMGGCLAHACKWSDEVVDDLEAGDNRQFFNILARMVHAYYEGLALGVFDAPEARNS